MTRWGLFACLLITAILHTSGASRIRTDVAGQTNTQQASADCDLGRYKELTGRFENIKYAGMGASGCVIIANDRDNGGIEVAIKLSKTPGNYGRWKTECDKTKHIHKLACEAGGLQMKLSERFLPNCLSFGPKTVSNEPYIIMHPVGQGEGLSRKNKMFKFIPPEERIPVWAQMVGALAALHGVGWAHNDLSNGNAGYIQKPGYLQKTGQPGPTKIGLLDFGGASHENEATYSGTYTQDETFIVRRAGELADCPESVTQDQHEPLPMEKKNGLIDCLRFHWAEFGADDEFFRVFGDVYDESSRRQKPKHILPLLHTAFVQKHFPTTGTLDRFFPNTECGGRRRQEEDTEIETPTSIESNSSASEIVDQRDDDDEEEAGVVAQWLERMRKKLGGEEGEVSVEDEETKVASRCSSASGQNSNCPHVGGKKKGYTVETCNALMSELGGDTFNYRDHKGACWVKKFGSEDMQYSHENGEYEVYSTFC